MSRRTRVLPGLMACAAAVAFAGCDTESEPADDLQMDTVTQDTMADTRMDQEVYEAQIEGVEGTDATGTATLTVENDELQVTVAVTGLDPNTRVPQHIHINSSCDDAGGIYLNLDDELSTPEDGQAAGDAFPETNDEGTLRYEATRSLNDLRTALGQADTAQSDTAQQTDTAQTNVPGTGMDQGAAEFDLGNRVVNLHGPDMQPIACGELESMHGQM